MLPAGRPPVLHSELLVVHGVRGCRTAVLKHADDVAEIADVAGTRAVGERIGLVLDMVDREGGGDQFRFVVTDVGVER